MKTTSTEGNNPFRNNSFIKDYFIFLNDLEKSGFSDMEQTLRYLQGAFDLKSNVAAEVFEEWKKTRKRS